MSKQETNRLDELEQRKRKIRTELNQLHHQLDGSMRNAGHKAAHSILPVKWIRKKPFKAIGASLLTGFILGLSRGRGKSKKIRKGESGSTESRPGMSSMIVDELKRVAARRAVQSIVEMVDEQLLKPGSFRSRENGSSRETAKSGSEEN